MHIETERSRLRWLLMNFDFRRLLACNVYSQCFATQSRRLLWQASRYDFCIMFSCLFFMFERQHAASSQWWSVRPWTGGRADWSCFRRLPPEAPVNRRGVKWYRRWGRGSGSWSRNREFKGVWLCRCEEHVSRPAGRDWYIQTRT